jgi:hypothetical protein
MVERSARATLIEKWQNDNLIKISSFYGTGVPSLSTLNEPPFVAARVVVGDTYIDEPIADFPSERLIATIALLLQARGEL